jgi:hypothetical protein
MMAKVIHNCREKRPHEKDQTAGASGQKATLMSKINELPYQLKTSDVQISRMIIFVLLLFTIPKSSKWKYPTSNLRI